MASDETIGLLRSIDASLKELVSMLKASKPKPVASDRDLDGRYGDPVVKFMPRDWTGPSFTGAKMSECPAPLLDLLAETFDYFARKAEENGDVTNAGKPVATYKRLDAARARGWAARVRAGRTQPAASGQAGEEWTDEGREEEWR